MILTKEQEKRFYSELDISIREKEDIQEHKREFIRKLKGNSEDKEREFFFKELNKPYNKSRRKIF